MSGRSGDHDSCISWSYCTDSSQALMNKALKAAKVGIESGPPDDNQRALPTELQLPHQNRFHDQRVRDTGSITMQSQAFSPLQ